MGTVYLVIRRSENVEFFNRIGPYPPFTVDPDAALQLLQSGRWLRPDVKAETSVETHVRAAVKRAVKPVAIGRKNCMFAGSEGGGKAIVIPFARKPLELPTIFYGLRK